MRKRTLLVLVLVGAGVACGSRSQLLVLVDRGADGEEVDAGRDSGPDALPPLDATKGDVNRSDCTDPSQTYIYFVTNTNDIGHFNPATLSFSTIGQLVCPTPPGVQPFSMAVDRTGVAYVFFTEWTTGAYQAIFRVSTKNGSCTPTEFVANQAGFRRFGMGFSSDFGGPAETLYVSADGRDGDVAGLGFIDINTMTLRRISSYHPALGGAELTGTGDGRLYAFYKDPAVATSSYIGELDKVQGQLMAADHLTGMDQGEGWAFAHWGGDFYLFTAHNQESEITRYQPATKTRSVVGKYGSVIVGAGVSTCAPQ